VASNLFNDQTLPRAQLDTAVELDRTSGDSVQLAISLMGRGYLDFIYFDLGAAQRDLGAALHLARATNAIEIEAAALRWLSAVAWQARDFETSAPEFLRADTLYRTMHDSLALSALQAGYGFAALARGESDIAERVFRAEQRVAERTGDIGGQYYSLEQLAQVELLRHHWSSALGQLEATDRFGVSHGLSGKVSGLKYLEGIALLRLGRLAEARTSLNRALSSSGPTQHLDQYAIHTRLAETELAAGDAAAAVQQLTAASDRLDSVRATLSDRDLRVLVFQANTDDFEPDLGFATIVAGLVRHGQTEAAFRLAERRRARDLEDRLLRARLLTGDSASLGAARPAKVRRDSLELLGEGTAVLEFLGGPAGQPTTLFVRSRTGLTASVLPALDSLEPDLERFEGLLRSGASPGGTAARIGAALLGSALAGMPASITRLVIIPDGALHRVPFAALPLADGRPLVARFAVSLAPSLAVAEVLASRAAPAPGPVLAMGDPAFGTSRTAAPRAEILREAFDASGGLPRLAASAAEARDAAAYADGSVLRLGADASEWFLKHTPLTRFRVLHFATHALVDDRTVARTALALAPGGGDDGFVTAGEIEQLSLDADLVVLSACRTADGLVIGGEGVQGLTAPFLQAGAQAVLATLWPVSDRAAARFELQVYQALARGITAGDALRAAQESAVANGEPASEWATFVLVGNPVTIVRFQPPGHRWRWGAIFLSALGAYWVWSVKARKLEATVPPELNSPRTRQL
jgi:hypothetical protein